MSKWWTPDGQLTLGELISILEKCKNESMVFFDFCETVPTDFHSYRGFYEDLQIGFIDYAKVSIPKVESFRELCQRQVNSIHTGWKGGEYRMTEETPLWVGHSGDATHTFINAVMYDEYKTILRTGFDPTYHFAGDFQHSSKEDSTTETF